MGYELDKNNEISFLKNECLVKKGRKYYISYNGYDKTDDINKSRSKEYFIINEIKSSTLKYNDEIIRIDRTWIHNKLLIENNSKFENVYIYKKDEKCIKSALRIKDFDWYNDVISIIKNNYTIFDNFISEYDSSKIDNILDLLKDYIIISKKYSN